MDDKRIIELFFARDEEALAQTEKKYGALCRYIASNILAIREDAEECVSDVMLALWQNIPPDQPRDLRAYIGKSVRNRAHEISRGQNAWKRGGRVQIVGDEFLSMLDDGTDLADQFEAKRAGKLISDSLQKLNKSDKKIFVLRYWMGLEINRITELTGYGESRIKMSLLRTRKKLAEELKKGGFTV